MIFRNFGKSEGIIHNIVLPLDIVIKTDIREYNFKHYIYW
jgi:hypothetical protein